MDSLLDSAFDPERFRRSGHQLIDQLASHLSLCLSGQKLPVSPAMEPQAMMEKWQRVFSSEGGRDPSDLFADMIADAIHLHKPGTMGHQVVPPAPLAALADLASAFLNNSMAVYEVGPSGTAMEKAVCGWLCRALGMGDRSGGILTSGGSLGNLTALLAARQRLEGRDVWREGLANGRPLAVMVSGEAHYSIDRAVRIMGLGERGIIRLPVNERFQAIPESLERALENAGRDGLQVMAVVASACTTAVGAYDPLAAMADFCQEHGIWLHVDGAHGAAAVLTPKYRRLVHGIDRADSVTVDFHKMLLCPALTTAVAFKDDRFARAAFSQQASYLLDPEGSEHNWDIAGRTIECTKKMMGAKIFVLLGVYGESLFAEYITRCYDLAADFAALIRDAGDFEIAAAPQSNILCFRFRPTALPETEWDMLNARIREKIVADGRFYIVRAEIAGRTHLRLTLMNPFSTLDDCRELLAAIRRAAHQS